MAGFLDEFPVYRVLAKMEGSESLTSLVNVCRDLQKSLDYHSIVIRKSSLRLSSAVRRYFYSNVAAETGGIDWWMLIEHESGGGCRKSRCSHDPGGHTLKHSLQVI